MRGIFVHSLEDRSEVAGILLFMLGSSEHVLVWSTQILKYVQAHVAITSWLSSWM